MDSYSDQIFHFIETKTTPDLERFIDINVDIAVQINMYLKDLGWTQKDFAIKLGKKESEISKWLSGMHNLTLKSISKMEAVLNREIIVTPKKASENDSSIIYFPLKAYATVNSVKHREVKFEDYLKEGKLLSEKIAV